MVSYLDLRGQELEGQNVDLIRACEQMKATIDLQGKAYASMVSGPSRESRMISWDGYAFKLFDLFAVDCFRRSN